MYDGICLSFAEACSVFNGWLRLALRGNAKAAFSVLDVFVGL
jgi:hypothetical protein